MESEGPYLVEGEEALGLRLGREDLTKDGEVGGEGGEKAER